MFICGTHLERVALNVGAAQREATGINIRAVQRSSDRPLSAGGVITKQRQDYCHRYFDAGKLPPDDAMKV